MEPTCTAFVAHTPIAAGPLAQVAAVAHARRHDTLVLILDDQTGRIVDLDLGASLKDLLAGLPQPAAVPDPVPAPPRGRGRPKLGVVSREVTLLPRHWDWLQRQPRSASATLRQLIETRLKEGAAQDRAERARDAAYGVMTALGGDLPGFEEASRALFAGDREGLERALGAWPEGLGSYVLGRFDGRD